LLSRAARDITWKVDLTDSLDGVCISTLVRCPEWGMLERRLVLVEAHELKREQLFLLKIFPLLNSCPKELIMTVAERRVIDAARTLARANSPPITDLIVGPAHLNLRLLFSGLLVAVKELDNPTPPPPGSGMLDEIQRAAGAYEKLFNNWCIIWHRDVIA
jgi:hypothetical protein